MDKVFIYWDNSNIYHEAQRLAEDGMRAPAPATVSVSTSRTCCVWLTLTVR